MNSTHKSKIETRQKARSIETSLFELSNLLNTFGYETAKSISISNIAETLPVFNDVILSLSTEFTSRDLCVDMRMEVGAEFLRYISIKELGTTIDPLQVRLKRLPEHEKGYLEELNAAMNDAFGELLACDVDIAANALFRAFNHPTLMQSFLKCVRAGMTESAMKLGDKAHPFHKHVAGFNLYFPLV